MEESKKRNSKPLIDIKILTSSEGHAEWQSNSNNILNFSFYTANHEIMLRWRDSKQLCFGVGSSVKALNSPS